MVLYDFGYSWKFCKFCKFLVKFKIRVTGKEHGIDEMRANM